MNKLNFVDIPNEFPVAIYGELTPYNSVLSKARCRIFYKYGNRNGTYITDEFAEQLLKTIAYAPVKGIYKNDDFTDHGDFRDEGRIYGVVPQDYNLQWEPHIDDDGTERIYACVDVLLYTGLYKEATEIVGASQSMEIYPPSIKGEYQTIDGQLYFVYTAGNFLGLQVLGDNVTPCFEGAAFYNLMADLKKFLDIYAISQQEKEEDLIMINFKLSDGQKHRLIFEALNPHSEGSDWEIKYSVDEVYDDYALCYNYEEECFERVYYTKNEDDTISLGEKKKCYIVDVTEDEKKTLEAVQALNNGTYENLDVNFEKLQQENSEFVQKKEELEEQISTLNVENENFTIQVGELNEQIASLQADNETLNVYKLDKENSEKQAIIDKYALKLSDEVINTYTENKENYSVSELEKELAFELVKASPNLFTQQNPIFKDSTPKEGIDAILENYRK